MTEQNDNLLNSQIPNTFSSKVKSKLEEYSKLKFLYNKTGNLLFKRNLTLLLQNRITQSLNSSSNNSSINLFSIPNIIEQIYGDYIRRHNLNITEEMIKFQKAKELKIQEYNSNTHKIKSKRGYNQKYITINTENSDTGSSLKKNYCIHTSKYTKKHNDKLNTIDNTESINTTEMYSNIQRRIISNSRQRSVITDKNIDKSEKIEKIENKNSENNNYNKISIENKGKENENNNINININDNEIFEYQPIKIENNNEFGNEEKVENPEKIINNKKFEKKEKEKRKHHHKHRHRHHHYQHIKRERILLPFKMDSFVLLGINAE